MAKLNKLAEATIFRKVLKIRNIDLPVHCPALASTCVVLQNMIRTQRPKKMTSFPAIFRLSLIFLEYKLVVNLGLGWAGLGWPGLCLAVLGWAWLGWAGLGWAGLGWAGLGWAGLGRAGQGWAGLGWTGLGWTGLGWAGKGWAGLG